MTFIAFMQASSGGEEAAGLACCGSFLLLAIGTVVLNIVLLIWVARDAKSRGMDGSVLWMLLVFFTSFLGLVIYLFSRPAGMTIRCNHCGNKRLAAARTCPHCGN